MTYVSCSFHSWHVATIRSAVDNDPVQTYAWHLVTSKPVSDFILCRFLHMWFQAYDFTPFLFLFSLAFCLIRLKGIMMSFSWRYCEDRYWYIESTWQVECVQCIRFTFRFSLSGVSIGFKRKENIWFSLSITKPEDESISAEIELCVHMWHRVEHFINF